MAPELRNRSLGIGSWELGVVGRWELVVGRLAASPRLPTDARKISHSRHADLKPFRPQELAFQLKIATVAAEAATRGDDTMAWRGGIARLAHDGADRTPGAGRAGKFCDIAVRGHTPAWNATHCGEHAVLEGRGHRGGLAIAAE